MAVNAQKLAYEDYLAIPEMRQRYEIIDGELMMAASPVPTHQSIVGNLYWALRQSVTPHGLGLVLMAPLDIVIRRDPLRTRQPDLLFLSAEHTGVMTGAQLIGMRLLSHVPDSVSVRE